MITVPLMRSMPPKKALELMMTGRRVAADEADRLGFVTRVVPVDELDAAVDELAADAGGEVARSIMKLGPRLVLRGARDRTADDALRLPAPDAHRHRSHRGRRRGHRRLRREAHPGVEGPLSPAAERRTDGAGVTHDCTGDGDLHDWGPLVDDLAQRRERGARAWAAPSGSSASAALGKLPVRERLDLLLDPGTFVEYGHARRLTWTRASATKGYLAADGCVTGIGEIDGRRVAVARLRLHRAWPGRWARSTSTRSTPHARARAAPAHPDGVAARLRRRAHPVDDRLDLRRRRRAVPRAGRAVAAWCRRWRRCSGHCAAGTAYIPALADFVPMVKGIVVDGARRPAPREGRHRRGRHRGGDGRLRGAHQGRRAWPTSRSPTTPSASRSCATTCRSSPTTTREPPPVRATADPVDRRVEELYDIVPTAPRRAYDMRKVIARDRRRRRRSSG